MITRCLWQISHPDAPQAVSVGTLAMCVEWRDRNPMRRPAESYVIERVPCCYCCGDEFADVRDRNGSITEYQNGQVRCDRHIDRNPCAIEGCRRTTEASGAPSCDDWLCADHWRRFVPPRSARRRAYHAFFRKGKRLGGWTWPLRRQFDRFWAQLIKTARAKAEAGTLDEAEINRLFGWGDEGPG